MSVSELESSLAVKDFHKALAAAITETRTQIRAQSPSARLLWLSKALEELGLDSRCLAWAWKLTAPGSVDLSRLFSREWETLPSMARRAHWNNGRSCTVCRRAHSDAERARGRAIAQERSPVETRKKFLGGCTPANRSGRPCVTSG